MYTLDNVAKLKTAERGFGSARFSVFDLLLSISKGD